MNRPLPASAKSIAVQLFDTQNSEATGVFPNVVHCDDPANGAFSSAPAKFCPRVEGKLATSPGFFEADHPLLPEHLVQRVSMLSCAGCHAPEQYLGSIRAMGCGQTWPNVAQRAHIDEFGMLSPALTESFLPRRADVMSMYLQACDIAAIQSNLEPAEQGFAPLPESSGPPSK